MIQHKVSFSSTYKQKIYVKAIFHIDESQSESWRKSNAEDEKQLDSDSTKKRSRIH